MSTSRFGERSDLTSFGYCNTEWGTTAAAMCATTCTKRSPFLAWTPKSYRCSAPMPNDPGSLCRGILPSVVGTISATSDKKKVRHKCLGKSGRVWVCGIKTFDLLYNLLSDWYWWCVPGSGQGSSSFTRSSQHGYLADA